MEITYIGHSCFKIKGKDVSLVFDPYDPKKTGYKLGKLESDIVLVSHKHFDHNFVEGVTGQKLVIDTPGEFESRGVFVLGLDTFHDDKKGEERGSNIIFSVDVDGFNLLHLGDLGHELTDAVLEELSDVDVLMIPVGGTYTIDAKTAAKVISSIEPGIVIPMHYQTEDLTGLSSELDKVEKFLDEMGIEDIKRVEKLKISSRSDVPNETEVVVIAPQH